MRNRKLLGWTIAVTLAWGLGGALLAMAEDMEEPSCEEACYEAEDRCFESCSSSEDVAACEDACVASTDACVERCE